MHSLKRQSKVRNLYIFKVPTQTPDWKGQDYIEVQVGNDQVMTQSERNSHSKNRGVEKNNKSTPRCLHQENISQAE